jgi:NhaA family Na+:H+ antiporter
MTDRATRSAGLRGMFERFVHAEAAGGVVLVVVTVLALAWANSPWAAAYFALARTKIGMSWGEASFALSLQHWINDLLMAVFFFVVGLEIKRELIVGQLSSLRRAILPASAAIGGMVVPAAIYAALNAGGAGRAGWGVPMATDIAFALGVLSLFGRRVPVGLKVFLTALAIADDLGAVLVIALFYSAGLRLPALAAAALLLGVLALASRLGLRKAWIYVVPALGVWACVLASGVHATVAGILVALLVPVRARRSPAEALAVVEDRTAALRARPPTAESLAGDRTPFDHVVDLRQAAGDLCPPGLALEQALHGFVAFVVLPLFAFWNAGVAIEGGLGSTVGSAVGVGIVAGLVLGKQAGVFLFAWIAVRSGRAALPEGVSWPQLYAVACLAGIGLTMSLFVAELAFPEGQLLTAAKVGVLASSVVSAAWGALWLNARLPRPSPEG